MPYTPSQLLDVLASQYATDPNKDIYLEIATSRTSTCAFGEKYNYAIALRAAHLLMIRDQKGIAGQTTSRREGDLAETYNNKTNSSDLENTSYGQELQSLINGNILRFGITGDIRVDC